MQFVVGKTYSRRDISDVLGGSIQLYLPTNEGRVVCGCFKLDRKYNPRAPEEVTFGAGEIVQKNAELLSQQTDPIPVFLFNSAGAWKYRGRYRCTGITTDPDILHRKMRENPARGVICGVLHLERVGD